MSQYSIKRLPLNDISFTNATLITSITRTQDAFSQDHPLQFINSSLGLQEISRFPSPAKFWNAICEQLKVLPRSSAIGGHPITALVLSGERASMPEFRQALKHALFSLELPSIADGAGTASLGRRLEAMLDTPVDPLWAAARGAARYARIRQQVPWDCEEGEQCHQIRGKKSTSEETTPSERSRQELK